MSILSRLSVVILSFCLFGPVVAGEIGCDTINWKPQILAGFAGIDQACQGIVVRDGKKYAHFEVKYVKTLENGKVIVAMRMNDGTWVERVFFAPKDFHVMSESGRTSFKFTELTRGDILDVYIPEHRIVMAKLGSDSNT